MHSILRKAALAVFLLGTVCTAPRAAAQSGTPSGHITFNWGEEYELPKRFEDLGFVGNSTDGYIQIGHRQHESLSFQKFDSKLHFTGESEVDISDLPRDYTNELFTQLGDKYYWFFSTYDKHEDEEALYVQEIDVKAGKLTGKAHQLVSTSKLTGTYEGHSIFSIHLADKWNFYYSFDKKKILIQYRKKADRGDDNRNSVFGLNVFDEGLTKLWGREVRFPYEERGKGGNTDFQVDNRGNVYTAVKVYSSGERGDRRHPDYHFEVFKWGSEGPAAHIPFRFTDKFVEEPVVSEDAKGNIIVAGYYSNRKHSGAVNGVFLLKLDPSSNELSNVMKGTYEFPASVLGQFENARTRRRLERREDRGDDVDASNMVLRDVRIAEDGSIQVIGEEYYIEIIVTNTGRSTSTRTVYHYNDILAMTISPDGNLKWMKKIPKSQASGGGSGDMGYKDYTFGGDTYFFFMDRESNLDLDPDHAPDTHSDKARGVLVAVKVDPTGKMTKEMVYNGKEEKVRITPTDFDEAGSNQLIVRGRARHKESQAALITFH